MKFEEWTRPPFDNETIRELQRLSANGEETELEDRFYRTLEFGTGGLRGVIGAGTNRMNIYTVGMATQGLANYILKTTFNRYRRRHCQGFATVLGHFRP